MTNDAYADTSLIDLFRMEAENQIRVLEDGLVALERDQRAEQVEPLMRAAHSLKGAARIVGLDQAVGLAHSMEDMLQAAQHGLRHLSARDIDLLLRGADRFKQLSQMPSATVSEWLAQHAAEFEAVRVEIANAPAEAAPATAAAASAAPAAPEREPAAPRPPAAPADTRKDGTVRVGSETLSRLLGLAGECLVEARALVPFEQTLRRLKSGHADARAALEDHNDPDSRARAHELLAAAECLLAQHTSAFELFSQRLENIADRLYREVIESRMRPFSDGVHGFSRMVRDQANACGKEVDFEVRGLKTPVDRDIMERLEAPLTHLLRNAVDHGLEPPEVRAAAGKPPRGQLLLEAIHCAGMLHITIRDDGRGIDVENLRAKVVAKGCVSEAIAARLSRTELFEFLFLPGFSTAEKLTEYSGRGVGLDVVQNMVQQVHGTVRIESEAGRSTMFSLQLPLTLSVQKTLLTRIAGEIYAFPLARVDRVEKLSPEQIEIVEGRQFFRLQDQCIGLIAAGEVLQLPAGEVEDRNLRIVVVSDRVNRYGVVVEQFLGEKELVVKPLDPRLGKVPDISAASILDDRRPVLIIDVDDLVRSVDRMLGEGQLARIEEGLSREAHSRKRVLVVDDSLTVREVERRLLESRGYEVEVAVDGMDGWNAVRSRKFDIVISDIDMPRLNGIELVRRIKGDPGLKAIPVMIVSYKDREEDRMLGLEAGADYYLTKSSFHDETLVHAVFELIGEP